MEIISIEFEYREKTYFALARIKEVQDHKEYHITIMNGALEQKLYGNHIFVEESGGVILSPVSENNTGELRLAVGLALCQHFNKPHHLTEDAV
jgi:hypothetical protein